MKKYVVLAVMAAMSVASTASASCLTSEPSCEGLAKFGPFSAPRTCVRMFWGSGGSSNFCVPAGVLHFEHVKTGDFACVGDAEAPRATCRRLQIKTE